MSTLVLLTCLVVSHCVLLFGERFLFTGDHLAWDREAQSLLAFEDYCWYSWSRQTDSMERLVEFRFEWVLPGHGQKVHLPGDEMRQQMKQLVRSMREGSVYDSGSQSR